ncbi:MAG: serine/threonine protein kinase, partial [Myxococcales bacterium]|nr:serine/threonine protein kinase [Myxococcales bacterium]
MGSDHTRLMALFDAFCDAEPAAQRAELARLRAAADPLAEPLAAMLQADEDTSALDHGIAVPGGPALPERYRLVDRIGQGGMGMVFRVLDAVLHRTVALKVVAHTAPEHVARFLAEARVVAQLQHPGIVPVHDLGTLPDGHPFFTMPEIQGQTWAALLRQWRPEPAWRRDAVYVLRQVAQAVAFAHEQGVVHRDLKPANVMVGAHGEVVVLDWGLARPLPDTRLRAMEGRQPTAAGMVMGTPGFMAPEQALGAVDQVGKPSDVYALGAM